MDRKVGLGEGRLVPLGSADPVSILARRLSGSELPGMMHSKKDLASSERWAARSFRAVKPAIEPRNGRARRTWPIIVVWQSQNGYPSSQSFRQANLAVGKRTFAARKKGREEYRCLLHQQIARAWSSLRGPGPIQSS